MSDRESIKEKEYAKKILERLQEVNKEMTGAPNQQKHQIVSFVKSSIRIIGYIIIPFNLLAAALILVLSEVVGIIEELV